MAKALTDYRSKRDFKKTAEPRGDNAIKRAPYPRFVIQKHDATRLHYDLRLEVDGIFKSWAVTRGPSLDPAEKRLAVEVEDHPLDYGDFEGTIPKGEYGGGTVMIWDRGYWSPLGEQAAASALRDGELKFNIAGDKLKGSWVLVRMKHDRSGGRRTNWLLIKHKDEWAKPGSNEKVLSNDRSVASGRTMHQIATGAGNGPTPFMLARRGTGQADDVWIAKQRKQFRATDRPEAIARIKPVEANNDTVLGVKISHADRVLWPAGAGDAVTKLQLAEYLATVGPWLIQHLRGRPCSVLRAPDGIGGQVFFQRHASKGMPNLIKTLKVRGDHDPYLQFDDVDGLIAMAQFGGVEFHPSNCVPFEPDVPARLIFDLDPAPDVPFSDVVEAAKEVRTRLEDVGLVAFCKTTGGKGLHVVTPLKVAASETLGWNDAKTFAHALSAQMAGDSPSRYLTKMTKKLRNGRIFIDYLRNDRLATAVAPLSPRARAGATVSMPLNWTQIRRDLDPLRYTVHSVPSLLAKSSAWDDYASSARPLRAAIKKLIGNYR